MMNDSHFVHNHAYIVCPQDITVFNGIHFVHNHSYIVCSEDKND